MNQEAGLQDVSGFLFGARGLSVTGTQSGEPSHFWNCSCSGGRWASLEDSNIHLQVGSLPSEEITQAWPALLGCLPPSPLVCTSPCCVSQHLHVVLCYFFSHWNTSSMKTAGLWLSYL